MDVLGVAHGEGAGQVEGWSRGRQVGYSSGNGLTTRII